MDPSETAADEAVVLVNGRPCAWRPGWTVAALLAERDAAGRGVAVERNGAVVRRGDHESTRLEPGDQVEIVRLVGGG